MKEAQQQLIEQQILLIRQQLKNEKEIHCLHMLKKYKKAIQNAENEDEQELFHNLRASVFLELKEIRDID